MYGHQIYVTLCMVTNSMLLSKVEKDDKTVITDFDLKCYANIFHYLGIACSQPEKIYI